MPDGVPNMRGQRVRRSEADFRCVEGRTALAKLCAEYITLLLWCDDTVERMGGWWISLVLLAW